MDSFLDKAFLLKFVKFCLVGFSGIFIDFGITYFLKEVAKVQQYVANAIGFSLAATSNSATARRPSVITGSLSKPRMVPAPVSTAASNASLWAPRAVSNGMRERKCERIPSHNPIHFFSETIRSGSVQLDAIVFLKARAGVYDGNRAVFAEVADDFNRAL